MKRIILAAMMLSHLGVAQAQPLPPTPLEQALFQRLGAEVEANVRASATALDLQRQLAAANETIRLLQERINPKPEAPTRPK